MFRLLLMLTVVVTACANTTTAPVTVSDYITTEIHGGNPHEVKLEIKANIYRIRLDIYTTAPNLIDEAFSCEDISYGFGLYHHACYSDKLLPGVYIFRLAATEVPFARVGRWSRW